MTGRCPVAWVMIIKFIIVPEMTYNMSSRMLNPAVLYLCQHQSAVKPVVLMSPLFRDRCSDSFTIAQKTLLFATLCFCL